MADNDLPGASSPPGATPFLPMAEGDGGFKTVEKGGVWLLRDGENFVKAFASQITKGHQALRLADIVSLPDIWGQAVCFQVSFNDKEHVLHRNTIPEWRGLLALIGLKVLRQLPIHVMPVDLANLSIDPGWVPDKGRPLPRARKGVPNLGRVIENDLPGFIDRLGDPQTKRGLVFFYKNKPIGFSFGHVLAIPARYYQDVLEPGEVPWGSWQPEVDEGRGGYPLRDPTSLRQGGLSDTERWALAEWIHELAEEITRDIEAAPDRGRSHRANLVARLRAYETDLREGVSSRLRVEFHENAFESLYADFSMPYRTLLSPPTIAGTGGEHVGGINSDLGYFEHGRSKSASTVEKIKSAELPLRDGGKARLWHRDLADSIPNTVLGGRQVGEIRERLDSYAEADAISLLNDLREKEKGEGCDLFVFSKYADDFFEPKIIRAAGSGATGLFLNHPKKWDDCLPPLKPNVLRILSCSQIIEHLRITKDVNGIKVVLRVPLGENGSKTHFEISKTYGRDAIVETGKLPSSLTVWPGFVHQDWHHYYVDCLTKKGGVRVTGLLGCHGESVPTPRGAALATKEFSSFLGADQNSEQQILLSERPVEAVQLGVEEAVGLCLVWKEAISIPDNNGSPVRVAIDLGSTATFAMMKVDSDNAVPLSLNAGLISLLASNAAYVGGHDHPPAENDELPVNTVLGIRKVFASGKEKEIQARRLDSFIPMPSAYSEVLSGSLQNLKIPNSFKFGLKYGGNKGLLSVLLKEFLLLAGAAVANNGYSLSRVEWMYSYPGTFLPGDLERFDAAVREAVALMLGYPVSGRAGDRAVRVSNGMEAACIGAFFSKVQNQVANRGLSVAVDIGGHSTDIRVFQEGKPVWLASLALAGQHIVTDRFVHHLDDLEPVVGLQLLDTYRSSLMNSIKGIVDRHHDAQKRDVRGMIELLIALASEKSGKTSSLQEMAADPHSPINPLVRIYWYGLLRYLALLLQRFVTDPSGRTPVSLLLGGRGGQLLAPRAGANFQEAAAHFMERVPGIVWQKGIVVASPAFAKKEVAYGLLACEGLKDDDLIRRSPLPMGADCTLRNGEQVLAGGYIPHDRLQDALTGTLDFSMFKDFLNNDCKDLGLWKLPQWSDSMEARAANRFNNYCNNANEQKLMIIERTGPWRPENVIQIQPPFIIALRVMIEEMALNNG